MRKQPFLQKMSEFRMFGQMDTNRMFPGTNGHKMKHPVGELPDVSRGV